MQHRCAMLLPMNADARDQPEFVKKDLTSEQRSHLLQVYAVERQDRQNSQIVVFAIVAAALTYFVASAGFLTGHYSNGSYNGVPSLVLLGSPLVPLALVSTLVVTFSADMMRAKHLKELETLLGLKVDESVRPSSIRDSSDIWEIKFHRNWFQVYPVLLVVTDSSIFIIALAYIFAVIIPGSSWPWYKIIVLIFYCLIILIQAAGLLVAAFHPRFKPNVQYGISEPLEGVDI